MKMVFLFEKEVRRQFNLSGPIPRAALPDFAPYDYGPFSSRVFEDLEFLVEMGFVTPRPADGDVLPEEVQEYAYWQAGSAADEDEETGFDLEDEFTLTEVGREFVEEELLGALSEDQRTALDEFKARCTGVSLRTLLHYIYSKYPDQTTNSKIREEILAGHANRF
jgi:hypothetical protein